MQIFFIKLGVGLLLKMFCVKIDACCYMFREIYKVDLLTLIMDYDKGSILSHEKNRGHLEVRSKVNIINRDDLSVAYTPGVAAVCLEIEKDRSRAKVLTSAKNSVAVISDGSAVLGLGNIGPDAAIPVMEGKCILFREFGGVDAYPIVLATQDTEEIIRTVKMIAPSFGGINLEDISAPRCFEIESRLDSELDIPVFHDDQHGTAIVVLAGIINGLKITRKRKEDIKVVVNGSGAAGVAITKLIYSYGVEDIIVCDSKGIVSSDRDDLNPVKRELLLFTNRMNLRGSLQNALESADVFIGVSKANLLSEDDVRMMAEDAMIFAMANPVPEIMPDIAKRAGARIVATGRSDFPNQLNNVLVFPGIFKGALSCGVKRFSVEMKIAAAQGLAGCISDDELSEDMIIPSPFDKNAAKAVSDAVCDFAGK
jgi:malate dehydrogenase (oxaloacetate-decarboxylating)